MKHWEGMRIRAIAVTLILTAGLLIAPGQAVAVAAASQTSAGNTQDISQIIFDGLWAGVNLNFDSITGMNHPQTNLAPTNSYAALGDSVAAGLGLGSPLSVPAAQSRCGRTAESYPVLVAQSLGMTVTDAACSGATAGDIVTVQRSGSPNQPAQLDTAFAGGTPALITITAGANDVHWQQFLFTCLQTNCATTASSATAATFRTALRAKLAAVFTDIALRSNGRPPTVIYTGYYNPISTSCQGRLASISPEEISWFSTQVALLNNAIQSVARGFSFVRFVPINFSGHDICSSDSWVQDMSDPAPIHPTATGQRAIAGDILIALGR